MDDFLDLVNDDLFDMSKSFGADDLLEDLDPMDLIQNLSCDFVEEHDFPVNGTDVKPVEDKIKILDNIKKSVSDINNSTSETAECKLMKIRQILDTSLINNLPISGKFDNHSNYTQTIKNNNKSLQISQVDIKPQVYPTNNVNRSYKHKNIIPKQPILPAMTCINTNNAEIMKNPTLAATLIDVQPSTKPNYDMNSNYDTMSVYSNGMDNNSSGIESSGNYRGVRKNSHNAIEKRYRLSINDKIDELRQMLFDQDEGKMNKSSVLKKAVERIKRLEDENTLLRNENYKLKISMHNISNSESIPQAGSSPISHHSDSSHSISHSPDSYTMHYNSSSSLSNDGNQSNHNNIQIDKRSMVSNILSNKVNKVVSPVQHQPSNQIQQMNVFPLNKHNFQNESNKGGIKRPLICDTFNSKNASNNPKNEKLARLLLSSSDDNALPNINYQHHQQQQQQVVHNQLLPNNSNYNNNQTMTYINNGNNNNNNTNNENVSNSSMVPNFLLCTLALFIVSFQPINMIMMNYRAKYSAQSPVGRHILQHMAYDSNTTSNVEVSFMTTLFVTLIHWMLALYLVWSSTKSYKYTKLLSSLVGYCWECLLEFIVPLYVALHTVPVEQQNREWNAVLNENNPLASTKDVLPILRQFHCLAPRSYLKLTIHCITYLIYTFIASLVNFGHHILSYTNSFNSTKENEYAQINSNPIVPIQLINLAIKQSVLNSSSISFFESLWYKLSLLYLIRDVNPSLANSARFLLAVSVRNKYLKKYLLNKVNFNELSNGNEEFEKFLKQYNVYQILSILTNNELAINIKGSLLYNDTVVLYYLAFVTKTLLDFTKNKPCINHKRQPDVSELMNISKKLQKSNFITSNPKSLTDIHRQILYNWSKLLTFTLKGTKEVECVSKCVHKLLKLYRHIQQNNDSLDCQILVGILELVDKAYTRISSNKLSNIDIYHNEMLQLTESILCNLIRTSELESYHSTALVETFLTNSIFKIVSVGQYTQDVSIYYSYCFYNLFNQDKYQYLPFIAVIKSFVLDKLKQHSCTNPISSMYSENLSHSILPIHLRQDNDSDCDNHVNYNPKSIIQSFAHHQYQHHFVNLTNNSIQSTFMRTV